MTLAMKDAPSCTFLPRVHPPLVLNRFLFSARLSFDQVRSRVVERLQAGNAGVRELPFDVLKLITSVSANGSSLSRIC